LSQLQGCLASGYPFVLALLFSIDGTRRILGPAVIPLLPANDQPIGGHAVMCVGYDNDKVLFKIRNSWGADVGDKGNFFMLYAYLTGGNLANDFCHQRH
jgi:C1A family cysteine protease